MNLVVLAVSFAVLAVNWYEVKIPGNGFLSASKFSITGPDELSEEQCYEAFIGNWSGVKRSDKREKFLMKIEVVHVNGPLLIGRLQNESPGMSHTMYVRLYRQSIIYSDTIFCRDNSIDGKGTMERRENSCQSNMDIKLHMDKHKEHFTQETTGTDGKCKMDKGYREVIDYNRIN